MERLKIAAIVLVIAGGLAGSYLIIKNSTPKISSEKKISENAENIKLLVENPVEWVKNLSLGNLSQFDNLSGIKNYSKTEKNVNFTEIVARSLFGQMKTMDQSGKNPFENFNPDSAEGQKMIQEALTGSYDPSSLFNLTIDDEDIKISENNSREAKEKYLIESARAVSKNIKGNEFYKNPIEVVEKAITLGDFSGLQKLIETYQTLSNDFINLSVPSEWVVLHKRYLFLMRKAELVYRGIKDIQNDPLKSSLFIQLLPELIDEEAATIKEYQQLANSPL